MTKIFGKIGTVETSELPAKPEILAQGEWGEMTIRQIFSLVDVEIREYQITARRDQVLRFQFEHENRISLSYFLRPISTVESGQEQEYLYQQNRLYVSYRPSGTEVKLNVKRDTVYQSVHILLDKNVLHEQLPHLPEIQQFIDDVRADKRTMLFERGREITSTMKEIILRICEEPDVSTVRHYFRLKSNVYQLFALLLSSSAAEGAARIRQYNWKASDIQKLQKIKAFLGQNAEHFYTIEQLSKEYAINVYKLKKGFKDLFGMGVFEYTAVVRMETALELIKNTELSLKEIAFQVGYSAPSSFTVAFKRHFGRSPRSFKSSS
ncbi:helix-turn-helix transcriptional regulator [Sphingobacterium suaedae]|uniref:Helix-turn-helix transcriptional regulator n=1 Tax=Sphingobacterium suaedae TaxID=1686402 RepID=A0ABW5KC60_9SPHI